MKNTKLFQGVLLFIFSFTLHTAQATDCFIGGVLREAPIDAITCPPPTKRECVNDDGGKGFRCGDVYNKPCVSLEPLKDISKNCYEASKGSYMSDADFQKMLPEFKKNYTNLCQETIDPINKNECAFLQRRITEMKKWADFPKVLTAPKADKPVAAAKPVASKTTSEKPADELSASSFEKVAVAKKTKVAPKKLAAGECANDSDKSTNKNFFELPVGVAPLTFKDDDMRCNFVRNQDALTQIAKSGCNPYAKQPDNHLMTTHIRPTHGACTYGENCYDVIITEMGVKETLGKDDVIYTVHTLKPSVKSDPAQLFEEPMQLHRYKDQYGNVVYAIIPPDGKVSDEVPVDIANSARSNLVKKYGDYPGTQMLQDNCTLAHKLADSGYYGANSAAPGMQGTSK